MEQRLIETLETLGRLDNEELQSIIIQEASSFLAGIDRNT
jgi:hypothetical protein